MFHIYYVFIVKTQYLLKYNLYLPQTTILEKWIERIQPSFSAHYINLSTNNIHKIFFKGCMKH